MDGIIVPVLGIMTGIIVPVSVFIWLYFDTKDYQKVIDLSYGTILLTIPSFAFFIILPVLLKMKQNFTISIIISIISTSILYFTFVYLLKKFGINI